MKSKATARFPKGYWPNTEHRRVSLRIPAHLHDGLVDRVARDPSVLNVNHAICVAVEDFLSTKFLAK